MRKRILWYSPAFDIKSADNIHQTLMYGTLQEIKALEKILGEKKIKTAFLNYPKKIYTAPALNFIKNIVLNINTSIDEQKYLKTTPRHIR